MNSEQVKSGTRWFVTTFGGVLAGYFAAWSNWFSADQIIGAMNSPMFLSIVASIVMGIWGIFNKTDTNIVNSASAVSSVNKIEMLPSKEGQAIADASPANVVVK